MKKKVLYVEDNPSCLRIATIFFSRSFPQIDFDTAKTSADGLALLEANEYDLIILDFYLPDFNGDVFASKAIMDLGYDGKIIYYSSRKFQQSELPVYVEKAYYKPLNRKKFVKMIQESLDVNK